jgi:pimeloyl-ACP methyl ester carboxylesterase
MCRPSCCNNCGGQGAGIAAVALIFGTEDARYPSSSAATYRAVPGARVELLPGVEHTLMMEDPQTTGTLLPEFAAAAARPG